MAEIILLGFVLAVLTFIFVALTWEKIGPLSFLMVLIIIVVSFGIFKQCVDNQPTALDVYRHKTTLVIHKETHGRTTLITDSVVEYKPQFRYED